MFITFGYLVLMKTDRLEEPSDAWSLCMRMTTHPLYGLSLKVFFPVSKALLSPKSRRNLALLGSKSTADNFLWYLKPQFDCQVCKSLKIELGCKVVPIKSMT